MPTIVELGSVEARLNSNRREYHLRPRLGVNYDPDMYIQHSHSDLTEISDEEVLNEDLYSTMNDPDPNDGVYVLNAQGYHYPEQAGYIDPYYGMGEHQYHHEYYASHGYYQQPDYQMIPHWPMNEDGYLVEVLPEGDEYHDTNDDLQSGQYPASDIVYQEHSQVGYYSALIDYQSHYINQEVNYNYAYSRKSMVEISGYPHEAMVVGSRRYGRASVDYVAYGQANDAFSFSDRSTTIQQLRNLKTPSIATASPSIVQSNNHSWLSYRNQLVSSSPEDMNSTVSSLKEFASKFTLDYIKKQLAVPSIVKNDPLLNLVDREFMARGMMPIKKPRHTEPTQQFLAFSPLVTVDIPASETPIEVDQVKPEFKGAIVMDAEKEQVNDEELDNKNVDSVSISGNLDHEQVQTLDQYQQLEDLIVEDGAEVASIQPVDEPELEQDLDKNEPDSSSDDETLKGDKPGVTETQESTILPAANEANTPSAAAENSSNPTPSSSGNYTTKFVRPTQITKLRAIYEPPTEDPK